MKAAFLIALALSGCEQCRQAQWQRAYNQKRALALKNGWTPARETIQKTPPPQIRSGAPMMAGGPMMMPPPIIVESAPIMHPQPSAPQPVIVVGPGSGTTIATQSSMGTVVSQFGGWQPPVGGYRPAYPQPVGYPYGY